MKRYLVKDKQGKEIKEGELFEFDFLEELHLFKSGQKKLTIGGVVASLLCVDSKDYSYITPDAKYKVIEKLQGCYKIVNDYGIEGVYEKDCFKEL